MQQQPTGYATRNFILEHLRYVPVHLTPSAKAEVNRGTYPGRRTPQLLSECFGFRADVAFVVVDLIAKDTVPMGQLLSFVPNDTDITVPTQTALQIQVHHLKPTEPVTTLYFDTQDLHQLHPSGLPHMQAHKAGAFLVQAYYQARQS
jgi:hypothetical protein